MVARNLIIIASALGVFDSFELSSPEEKMATAAHSALPLRIFHRQESSGGTFMSEHDGVIRVASLLWHSLFCRRQFEMPENVKVILR